ncbi:MAG TPA: DUF362 domain-containing protein, partial [Thermoleophilia bacterium]|nr:DUF362 domain-containing protein [Thermoleophilia bacterium]
MTEKPPTDALQIPVLSFPLAEGEPRLPAMHLVRQRFVVPPAVDPVSEIDDQWPEVASHFSLPPGASVAVAVGSRGVARLNETVRHVVAKLRELGLEPFIVPAMGSHGGATAEGQTQVLAHRGITEETVGAPLRATMEVVVLGEAEGIPLYLDRYAHEADGVVLVNRVKPHTDFVGPVESGALKMLAIGLGKQAGADEYHRYGITRGLGEAILTVARALLARANVLFAVATVENQDHEPMALRLIPPEKLEASEMELLTLARSLLPRLPLADIDLLIVDEMGKEISGAGMDPNVIGSMRGLWMEQRQEPRIARILVRRLSAATQGNALGLGMVSAVSRKFVAGLDFGATATNALVSCTPEDAKLPLVFASEREAIAALLTTIRPYTDDDLRLVWIRDTMRLER